MHTTATRTSNVTVALPQPGVFFPLSCSPGSRDAAGRRLGGHTVRSGLQKLIIQGSRCREISTYSRIPTCDQVTGCVSNAQGPGACTSPLRDRLEVPYWLHRGAKQPLSAGHPEDAFMSLTWLLTLLYSFKGYTYPISSMIDTCLYANIE